MRAILAVNVTSDKARKFLSNLYINKDEDQFENGPLAETEQTEVVQKLAQYVGTTLVII
jgi:hypothetical protein